MVLGLNYYYQGGHDTMRVLIQRNNRKETKITVIIKISIFIFFRKMNSFCPKFGVQVAVQSGRSKWPFKVAV